MAYITNGYIVVTAGSDQLIIDDFDGGIDISTDGDKTTTRSSTQGYTIASMKLDQLYNIEVNIPPFTGSMIRVEDFYTLMKSKSFPDLTIAIYERIDTRYRITTYVNGNFKSELDYDSAISDEAPKGKIVLFGTKVKPIYTTI